MRFTHSSAPAPHSPISPPPAGNHAAVPGAATGCEDPIRAQDTPADVIDRHPELLETFLAHGFRPLANPMVRKQLGRVVTLATACQRMGVDLDAFLAALNARCRAEAAPESSGK